MPLSNKQLVLIDNGLGNPEQMKLINDLLLLSPTVSYSDFSHSEYLDFPDPSQDRSPARRDSFSTSFEFQLRNRSAGAHFAVTDLEVTVPQLYVKIKDLILRMGQEASIDTVATKFGTITLGLVESMGPVEIGVHRAVEAIIVGVSIYEGDATPEKTTLTVTVDFNGFIS